ncbi:malto-oligosyltrehalose trehalohydrolase [Luteolibacter sp. GHJ8]|uniref:Malto-oligosyltrehalose trehalohydrolase n=1 Tax=Luteolibacter rhizosphaerae TaxID=2989719 RepID=A0ABT3G153_9BACT|nr:malto-oligosyltrehalose trehalohydrolase [Luteolibacter rhizosphaerae]MCW1912965.1 malto-oligosyltrehalose trehalohydrolase [Luteolibacter rhizosphaerae]
MGSKLKVWAPAAADVKVVADGEMQEMVQDGSRPGWWQSRGEFPPATRYGFLLDGRGPLPDPRSPSQPEGVHGLSQTVDHSLFPWTDREWMPPAWPGAVVYELHVGTFTGEGTFRGAIGRLGELVDLGVTHVELLPVGEFPGDRGWGYDVASIFAPHHAYGGPEELKYFVDACHDAGLAVILDVVYNHPGPDGNYLASYGPYFTNDHVTPWGDGPNLDGEHRGEVRDFFIGNALMWMRHYHVDGLRLDAIDKVKDDSPEHFLIQLRNEVDRLAAETGRPYVLIAESAANDPCYVIPRENGGYGMNAQWNDDIHHSIRTFFTKESESYYCDFGRPEHVVKSLVNGYYYDGCYSPHREGPHGHPPGDIPGHALMAYLQTHDQIGNRALGDRFHQHERCDELAQQIASAFILLSPYVPMIFMGEEWAATTPFMYFTNYTDRKLAGEVAMRRQREFGEAGWPPGELPDPEDPAVFRRSKLDWHERDNPGHREMLDWYRRLLALRRGTAELGTLDRTNISLEAGTEWLLMRRGPYIIAGAIGESITPIPAGIPTEAKRIAGAGAEPRHRNDGTLEFPGKGIVIFGP